VFVCASEFSCTSITFAFKIITVAVELKSYSNIKGKGKAIPLQAWTGPEGSRRLRLPDFKTIGT